jgi:hypothetical protein
MITALLILHGLLGVALLGALTHQLVSLVRAGAVTAGAETVVARAGTANKSTFMSRYTSVGQGGFTLAVIVLYVLTLVLGAVIYPTYRLDVRIPFEEMSLIWAVGLFEVKEHWGGIGLGVLPLYAYVWRPQQTSSHHRDRLATTILLSLIVWSDFLAGHVLNNIRGL